MILEDFHIHTTFCDGKNTPEEMVLSAIEKGMPRIGFSGHSYLRFGLDYCMQDGGEENYKKEVLRLKEKYKDQIEIYLGIEQDIFSPPRSKEYEYVIGSVHHLPFGEEYVSVDNTAQDTIDAIDKYCGGDRIAFAEKYFELVSRVVEVTGADIIGHFDLITKFDEKYNVFDHSDPRYIAAWKKAVDKLVTYNVPFEVNTGAISRGYRTTPYPAPDILEYIHEKGGRVVMNGDTHSAEMLCCQFDKWAPEIEKIGFTIEKVQIKK